MEINKIFIKNEPITLNDNTSDTYINYGKNEWQKVNLSTKISSDSLNYDDIFEEMMKRFSVKPVVEHKCHNCGATLEIEENNHIFHCQYCNSVYAIGTSHINSI